jgi:UDP-2,3-diacylglucosamine pyrophosphatase LpxH
MAGPELIVYDTILVSDVHLGSALSRAEELKEFLQRIRVQQLILAGDIFDDLNFHRLHRSHWETLGQIRKMSDHCKVVWVRGNHDVVSAPTLSHLLGIDVMNHYIWKAYGKRFYAIHGDRWDTFIYRHQRLTALLTWLYNTLSRFNSGAAQAFTRWLKKRAKLLTRNNDAVRLGAVGYAVKHGFDVIFCGHTHMPALVREESVIYGNDGTWQSDDPHFIGVLPDRIDLCRYTSATPRTIASLPYELAVTQGI